MKEYINSLDKCVLFKSIKKEDILKILEDIPYSVSSYSKNEIIALEHSNCSSLGIILQGNIEIHKSFVSGQVVTINNFGTGNIFGEALVFSDKHTYPATIVSSNDSKIMYIKREDIVKMMNLDSRIIDNFMGVLSNRILMLNERITNLSYDTIRKKIINILLNEYKRQRSFRLILPYSRKKMAQILNIPRPSLSRELANMKEDSLIDYYKNRFEILDLEGLENELL